MRPKYYLIVVCFILFGFSGCGVSNDDFEAKVEELEAAKQQVITLEAQLKEKEAKIAAMGKSSGESAQKEKEALDKYANEMNKLRSQNAAFQKQLTEKTAKMTQLQDLLNQKTGALANVQAQLDKLKLSSLGSASELSDLKAIVSSKDAALKDKDAQISAKDSQLQKKDSQIAELMKQLEALKKGDVSGLGGAGGLLNR